MIVDIYNEVALIKSFKSFLLIILILLVRKFLNKNAFKSASIILWALLFAYLICPYQILIRIEEFSSNKVFNFILYILSYIDSVIRLMSQKTSYVLYPINRYIVTVIILCYVLYKYIKFDKIMKDSKIIHENKCIDYIKSFKLRRTVSIYINNNLKTPVTYGLLKPKIILQSYILDDEELLKYVMMHELTHIKRFHILFNHIVNIVACVFWCNPLLIVSLKYLEQDIEIFTDKEVISRLGDTLKSRKDYCKSMFKLMSNSIKRDYVSLKLNPNLERMIIMKNYKKTILGSFIFALTFLFSIPVFASVVKLEKDRIEVIGTEVELQSVDNSDGRIHIISEEEYSKLKLNDIYTAQLKSVNVNNNLRLGKLEYTNYLFDNSNLGGLNYNGFTLNLSDLSCNGGIKYNIIIMENNKLVYDNEFKDDTIIKMKTTEGCKYEVLISNKSINILTGEITINACEQ